MEFDWDAGNVQHIARHRVTAAEAEEALAIRSVEVAAAKRGGETRIFALGRTKKGRVLAVVFTVRNNRVRVITARDASRKERKAYAGNLEEEERG